MSGQVMACRDGGDMLGQVTARKVGRWYFGSDGILQIHLAEMSLQRAQRTSPVTQPVLDRRTKLSKAEFLASHVIAVAFSLLALSKPINQ